MSGTDLPDMASSRIFVRGLPPTFTEEEFRKHFERGETLTDAKLFPQRRIGYVGYKTPEDAIKAVKYFNKSFIRMSRIRVELARPINDETIKPRRGSHGAQSSPATDGKEAKSPIADPSSSLKRKRDVRDEKIADPKLQEFLEVMQPPSKIKSWANEGLQSIIAADVQVDPPKVSDDDGDESDAEYQSLPKRPKPTLNNTAAPAVQTPAPEQLNKVDSVMVEETSQLVTSAAPPEQPMTDADWLRSRTNRLLDLEDDVPSKPSAPAVVDTSPVKTTVYVPQEKEEEVMAQSPTVAGDKVEPSKSDEDAIRATSRLFLRNLPFVVTEEELRERFSEFGDLQEVHVPVNSSTGKGKGFAYILFANPEHAVDAYRTLDGTIFQGRLLHVLPAAAKKDGKLDEFEISKLPLKKQREIQKKAQASTSTFNWNSLYLNADSVMSSIADRLGVDKGQLLDPTSSDAAVKQAQAETHVISEIKSYFAQNGVDLEAFKKRQRGDNAILVKNIPYGTTADELRKLFEEHGQISKFLMPPNGMIAIVEFPQPPEARAAFHSLAYRKFKDSVLFLEKAPKDVFKADFKPTEVAELASKDTNAVAKLSTTDLLSKETLDEVDTSTLYVRNLNFSTTTDRLTEVFKPLEGFLSARVKTKTDPKKPGQILSMGFGFLEFRTKAQAQAALAAMDGYNLDGHKLVIKASHKGADAAEERRKEDRAKRQASRQTKIIIKNLPFEATKKDIRTLFGSYGQLRSVRLPKKFDSSTRGFAFAEFTTAREAETAMDALRNTHLLGRRLVLDFASADPEDAEEEIEKMQQKVGSQLNKVALQKLTSGGRKKFNVAGTEEAEV